MLTRRSFVSLSTLALLGLGLPSILQGCEPVEAAQAKTGSRPLESMADQPSSLMLFLFDTVIGIEAYCPQEVLAGVEERLRYFESILSKTATGSDVYAINHADGNPTPMHPETADLITQALRYSELSGGLFDITVGGVMELWDFKNHVVPDPDDLAEALLHVDYRTVGVEGQTVTLTDPEAAIDLGGIAKGYIADDIVSLLKTHGCTSALINLGGNTYALGTKLDGSPWSVGLQDPNQPRGTQFASVSVANRSVVASGINERSFEANGTVYHHLIDPRTGMPQQNGTASATIVSERSLDGDAFSTITFLLGAEKGLSFIQEQPGAEVLFVGVDGSRAQSEGLEFNLL